MGEEARGVAGGAAFDDTDVLLAQPGVFELAAIGFDQIEVDFRAEVAVAGTLNESVPGEIVPNEVTVPPPTVTVGLGDFSFKPQPVMVTTVLGGPDVGEKLEMLGRIRKSSVD